uniref:Serine protease 1 n=1 Tax=Holotrichia oblita TaxID=644536 RepID=A0A8D4IZN6_HOLOL|nr:serine protease 1 [Holotrichia oblita]
MYLANILIVLTLGISLAQSAATKNENQTALADYLTRTTRLGTTGTDVTDRTQYSYHASVQLVEGNTHLCSASLIDKEHLLTSAFCLHDLVVDGSITNPDDLAKLKEAEDLQVVLGIIRIGATTDRVVKALKYIFIHEDWAYLTGKNDIAVLRIEEAFEDFTDNVKSIGLATATPAAGAECRSSGWTEGATSSNLKVNTFKVVARGACTTAVGAATEGQFCGEDSSVSCQGELGSPVICNAAQAGIVSQYTCATTTGPMTDVSYYADWIEEQQKRSGSSSLMNSAYLLSICIFAWMYMYKN